MPKYRFSWQNFDDATIEALASRSGWDSTNKLNTLEYLTKRQARPDEEFVGSIKEELEATWLKTYPGLGDIVDQLLNHGLGPGSKPRSQNGYLKFVKGTKNTANFRRILLAAILRYGESKTRLGPGSQSFGILDPEKQPGDGRVPFAYQTEAWDKLTRFFADAPSGDSRGLLVMPTGSGKTFTAVRWILEHVINADGRVLWIAHRQELLDQAAEAFHMLAGLSRRKLRIRKISGADDRVHMVDPADDVVIASVQSLARNPELAAEVLRDRFITVDEAHHAAAPSYRRLLKLLPEGGRSKILGLTATPTRTAEDERGVLSKLFQDRILYQIDIRTLIEQGVLARPIPVSVKTNADMEAGITQEDLSHLSKFNELSDEWKLRIAQMAQRNTAIVRHYLDNAAKYGKTLIFAVNVEHAYLLAKALTEHGVEAGFVASYSPSADVDGSRSVLDEFRNGSLKVLANCQIMTEGVDVPDIQTVFLARPTASEILVRQMIGRALRGPNAKGTATAYIVSFEDHWERFRNWENPLDFIAELQEVGTDPAGGNETPPANRILEEISPELLHAALHELHELRRQGYNSSLAVFEAVPHGWYVVERDDLNGSDAEVIPVYAHQKPCWDALIARVRSGAAGREVNVDNLEESYFGDCTPPAPCWGEISRVVEALRSGKNSLHYHDFSERNECDPMQLARRCWDQDLGERAKSELLRATWDKGFTKKIFPDVIAFERAVDDALAILRHPDEVDRPLRGFPVFEAWSDNPLREGEPYDLAPMLDEVLATGAPILGKDKLTFEGHIAWTQRPIKGWFGMAYLGAKPGHGSIRINRLLCSPDVSDATLRYLLWHEYLHLYLNHPRHSLEFRNLERAWPGWMEGDREMDTLNQKFHVQYWPY